MRGFWLANWFKTATPDKITEMYDRLTPLVVSGAISSPVAGTYQFRTNRRSRGGGVKKSRQGAFHARLRRAGREPDQATLTELRNLPTSSLSRLLSLDSDFAAE